MRSAQTLILVFHVPAKKDTPEMGSPVQVIETNSSRAIFRCKF